MALSTEVNKMSSLLRGSPFRMFTSPTSTSKAVSDLTSYFTIAPCTLYSLPSRLMMS